MKMSGPATPNCPSTVPSPAPASNMYALAATFAAARAPAAVTDNIGGEYR